MKIIRVKVVKRLKVDLDYEIETEAIVEGVDDAMKAGEDAWDLIKAFDDGFISAVDEASE